MTSSFASCTCSEGIISTVTDLLVSHDEMLLFGRICLTAGLKIESSLVAIECAYCWQNPLLSEMILPKHDTTRGRRS